MVEPASVAVPNTDKNCRRFIENTLGFSSPIAPHHYRPLYLFFPVQIVSLKTKLYDCSLRQC